MKFLNGLIADYRTRKYLSNALVVFSCTAVEAARIDVARGPCIERIGPRGGRQRPLAPRSSQLYSAKLADLGALYRLLADDAADDALHSLRREGRAHLAQLSDRFVTALATLESYGARAVAERWAAVGSEWSIPQMERRLFHCVVAAKEARDKGELVFAWEGPAAPEYVIVRGSGPHPDHTGGR